MAGDLRKVTLNLFDDDIRRLEIRYGYGWSKVIRERIHRWLRESDFRSDSARGVITDGE